MPTRCCRISARTQKAQPNLLLAGLCVAAREGFEMKNGEAFSRRRFAGSPGHGEFDRLPSSCFESALNLEKDRIYHEKHGIFPPALIDQTVAKLKSYDDKNFSERLYGKENEIEKMVAEYLYF